MTHNLLALPNELLHLVAENLKRPKDLVSLVLTCRHLASLCTPRLHNFALEDKDGLSALHWASKRGHKALVQLILDHGYEVDPRDDWEATPLHLAAYEGHQEITFLLLEYGANVFASDKALNNAMHNALFGGDAGLFAALLESVYYQEGFIACRPSRPRAAGQD